MLPLRLSLARRAKDRSDRETRGTHGAAAGVDHRRAVAAVAAAVDRRSIHHAPLLRPLLPRLPPPLLCRLPLTLVAIVLAPPLARAIEHDAMSVADAAARRTSDRGKVTPRPHPLLRRPRLLLLLLLLSRRVARRDSRPLAPPPLAPEAAARAITLPTIVAAVAAADAIDPTRVTDATATRDIAARAAIAATAIATPIASHRSAVAVDHSAQREERKTKPPPIPPRMLALALVAHIPRRCFALNCRSYIACEQLTDNLFPCSRSRSRFRSVCQPRAVLVDDARSGTDSFEGTD